MLTGTNACSSAQVTIEELSARGVALAGHAVKSNFTLNVGKIFE